MKEDEGPKQSFSSTLRALPGKYVQFVLHNGREIRRRKVGYCLGFFSVFLVVLVVSAAVTTLNNVPVIFFSLAEIERGQTDMFMQPSGSTSASALRFSVVQRQLSTLSSKASLYSSISPRIILETVMWSDNLCAGRAIDNVDVRYNASTICPDVLGIEASFFAIDSATEKRIGVGREWDYPSVPVGGVYLLSSVAGDLRVAVGDYIYVQFDMNDVFSDLYYTPSGVAQYLYGRFRVERVISDVLGKTANTIDKAAFAEIGPLLAYLAPQVNPKTPNYGNVTSRMAAEPSSEFSTDIILNLPAPRLDWYNYNNYDKIQSGVSRFGAVAMYRVGFNQIFSRMPLLFSMQTTRFFSLFLGLIIFMVVAILAVLSIILIYSLLMVSVETRTFELGLLRMIGMRRSDLIQLILVNALMYAVPAWVCGLVAGQLLAFFVANYISSELGIELSPLLTPLAIGIATLLAYFIPMFASIFPIRSALTMNLQDSLDTRHSKTKAVVYHLERSETGRMSLPLMIVGLMLVVFGAFVFYFFPLALLSLQIELLIYMFFALLMALLFGLVLLAMNLETLMEKFVTFFFLFWETHAMRNMIHKNLTAHRLRNRKTSMMYALSLAFIIFLLVSLDLQIQSLLFQRLQQNGGRITVTAKQSGAMNELGFLRQLENRNWGTSFGYVFQGSNNGLHFDRTVLETLGHFAFTPIRVQAGSPNLFDVAISGFLKVAKQNDSSGLSVIQQLYTTRGAAGTLLGSVYEDTFQMKNDYYTPVQVRTEVDTSRFPAIEQQYVRTVALMDVAPVFALSKFRAGGDGSSQSGDMVVSLPSLLDLGRNATLKTQSIRSYPIRKAIFDTNGMTESQIKKLKDGLNAVVASAPGVGLSDLQDSLAALLQGVGILQIFFSFTILIAMVMCFFSLTSSMFTNIYEQSKEIGILRAVGCKRHFIIRLYVYEAFVLVVASSFLGIMIGVVVGYTMVIQRALFTQLPIPFVFPYFYVAVVVFFAIIFALLAAFSPARKMSREGIVATLRRING